jgi:hypothetical protein
MPFYKQSGVHTFHFADLDKKDDIRIAKLNKGDLALFDTANSFCSEGPLKVKADSTGKSSLTHESDATVRVTFRLTHSDWVPSH